MNNELSRKETRTPIEVLLEMDENNMVSAKKLYEFLELDPSHYARWCKRNIIDNPIVDENIDYECIRPAGEAKAWESNDYLLEIHFAEELCMTCQNEKGRQARKYFRKVEDSLVVTIRQYNELVVLLKEEIEQRKTLEKRLDNVISDLSELRLESNRVSDFTKRNEPYFKKIMDHYLKSPSSVVRSCADKDFITDAVIRLMEKMDAKFKYDWAVNEYRSMYQRDIPKHKYSMIDCLPEYQLLFTLALAKLVEKLGD